MQFDVEKHISPLIEKQFPSFYESEGPMFIQFVKAYYEWMEQNGNPIGESRKLFDYRDIDNTLTDFLSHFQQKYLYGIPFKVIVDKRLLIKHTLDVYRSKGNIQGYKLLFRLLYNEDIDVYIPGYDIIKPSDGTWIEPKFLEVTPTKNFNVVGQTITGLSSGTTAIVENVVIEPINKNIITKVFISNILPIGADFKIGEKILLDTETSNTQAIIEAPTLLGSIDYLDVQYGGFGYKKGDILSIAHRDPVYNSVISNGIEGTVLVNEITSGNGVLGFTIVNGGSGYNLGSNVYIYNSEFDTTGSGANFSIGRLTNVRPVTYNTDLLIDYANLALNATSFGFPTNTSANVSSVFSTYLNYITDKFGSISALTDINTGAGYIDSPYVFIRSTQTSIKNLPGSVSYDTTSNTVSGTGTYFSNYFSSGDVIHLVANSSNSSFDELLIVKTVVNDTTLYLYAPPTNNSTPSAGYRIAPLILNSSYPPYSSYVFSSVGSIAGRNANVVGYPATGNNIVANAYAINSGKGYAQEEFVSAYLYNSLETPKILNPGLGYSNGDALLFLGGSDSVYSSARGTVITDNDGKIVDVNITSAGSGYKQAPVIRVSSNSHANLQVQYVSNVELYTTQEYVSHIYVGVNAVGYDNTDIIKVLHTGGQKTVATMTTNSIGGITNTSITITEKIYSNALNASSLKIVVANSSGGSDTVGNNSINAFSLGLSTSVPSGYDNTDILYFSGGSYDGYATFITDDLGIVNSSSFTIIDGGSFLSSRNITPGLSIVNSEFGSTTTGNNSTYLFDVKLKTNIENTNKTEAKLTTNIKGQDTTSFVQAKVVKTAVGKVPGYWSTTRSFLNADKFIQDSYFYQDFSYQIKAAQMLEVYKYYLYETFHTSGTELFGEFFVVDKQTLPMSIYYESNINKEVNNPDIAGDAELATVSYYTVDNTTPKADSTNTSIDLAYKLS